MRENTPQVSDDQKSPPVKEAAPPPLAQGRGGAQQNSEGLLFNLMI